MNTRTLKPLAWLIAVTLTGGLAADAFADPGKGVMKRNSRPVPVIGTDGWQPNLLNEDAEFYCSDGTEVPDPANIPCEEGTTLEVRNVTATSWLSADDPRATGQATFTFSASFDAVDFSGPAWGTWTMEVEACDGAWEGTFQGDRSLIFPDPMSNDAPVWISNLEIRGIGSGCIRGLRLLGTELITTVTPLPLAYELLGMCDFGPCLPEGVFAGKIYGPSRRGSHAMDMED